MPDADGNFRGTGWSRSSEDAWTRVFSPEADLARRRHDWLHEHVGDELPEELRG